MEYIRHKHYIGLRTNAWSGVGAPASAQPPTVQRLLAISEIISLKATMLRMTMTTTETIAVAAAAG
jgi:hypothetical protein